MKTKLPAPLAPAIEEQQIRVWQLRNLLEAVAAATTDGNGLDDARAAMDGLLAMADEIHLALDTGAIEARAEAIREEAARDQEIEARQQAAAEDPTPKSAVN